VLGFVTVSLWNSSTRSFTFSSVVVHCQLSLCWSVGNGIAVGSPQRIERAVKLAGMQSLDVVFDIDRDKGRGSTPYFPCAGLTQDPVGAFRLTN